MENFCKIYFKDKEYTIDSVLDFNSEHSRTSRPRNVYFITTNEIPQGFLTDISSKYAIKAVLLKEELWRPEIKLKTKLNKEDQTLQYTIIISDKGE